MGRVFSYAAIESGLVPTASSFELAQEAFSEAVVSALATGALSGSVVYGSVAIDRATMRSDFDCLLALPDLSSESATAAQDIVRAATEASEGKVEISAIPYPKEVLRTGRHEIDRFFGHHLTGSHRLVQGEDPATYLTYAPSDAISILDGYLRNKKRRISNTLTSQDEAHTYQGLQRMLEAPLAVGRKALRVVDELEGTQNATANSADKVVMSRLTTALFSRLGVNEGVQKILGADRDYSQALQAAVAGDIDSRTYADVLADLHAQLPSAIKWLDDFDIAFHNYVAHLPATKPVYR